MLICLQFNRVNKSLKEPANTKSRYLSIRTVIELTSTYDTMAEIFSQHFARFGLSQPRFNALIQLRMAGDRGLTQSELGQLMLVSRANISGLVERLERDGLVGRQSDPGDKRALRVYITDRGQELMEKFLPIHNDFVSRALSSLTDSEMETLQSLLTKIKKGFEKTK